MMKFNRWQIIITIFALIWVLGAVGVITAQEPELNEFGEIYDAPPEILMKALGTTEGVPDVALAAFYRASLPVSDEMAALATAMLA